MKIILYYINIDEAKHRCQGRSNWKAVVSATATAKRREVYVCTYVYFIAMTR